MLMTRRCLFLTAMAAVVVPCSVAAAADGTLTLGVVTAQSAVRLLRL